MIFDKLKDVLPGTIVSLVITFVTTAIVFWGNYSALKAEVINNTELIKNKSDRKDLEFVIKSNEKLLQGIDKRLDRLENKVDKVYERMR
jgi:hypothetical protein